LPSTLATIYLTAACGMFIAAKQVIPITSIPSFIKQSTKMKRQATNKNNFERSNRITSWQIWHFK
jgi:hypothetical protein